MPRRLVRAAVPLIVCFLGGWYLQSGLAARGDLYHEARLFETVLQRVRDRYVDSLPESQLYRRAAEGLLARIGDPYAELLVGRDYARMRERVTGDYTGVGLLVEARNGWVTVVSPLPGSPGAEAGIEAGDQIVSVDGISTAGWSIERVTEALRGPAGAAVTLGVRRRADAPASEVRLTRRRIHRRSVTPGLMLDNGIGYVAMSPVRDGSAAELAHEVERLSREGMRALILDLRSNGGGPRDEAIHAADLFLDPGLEILRSRGRAPESNDRWVDASPQPWPRLPIVVLVNEGTASAAEIIAGALQDHDRALIVGDTTYGKGVVQTIYPLGDGVALRLTTARWYTPAGRSIQRETDSTPDATAARPVFRTSSGRTVEGGGGIVPDVVVLPDTLTSAEQVVARALAERLDAWRDIVNGYALELRHAGRFTDERFELDAAIRAELRRRVLDGGFALSAEELAAGAGLIERQLGYEVARYAFGQRGELRRRIDADRQVAAAVALLRASPSPEGLLGLAPAGTKTPGTGGPG